MSKWGFNEEIVKFMNNFAFKFWLHSWLIVPQHFYSVKLIVHVTGYSSFRYAAIGGAL